MDVIPAINGTTLEVASSQIMTVAPFAEWVHVDVADGIFTRNVTWGKPDQLHELIQANNLTTNFEIHLMVTSPEELVEPWFNSGAKRVIVHVEAMTNPVMILDAVKAANAEVVLAAKPDTPAERLLIYKDDFKIFQVLAVEPGLAGQSFNEGVIKKIQKLREGAPDNLIEIDGGVNPDVAAKCKAAGANIAISASYIFDSGNPQEAYETLRAV
jgi:ribulose-phosphate 3-epimerase